MFIFTLSVMSDLYRQKRQDKCRLVYIVEDFNLFITAKWTKFYPEQHEMNSAKLPMFFFLGTSRYWKGYWAFMLFFLRNKLPEW